MYKWKVETCGRKGRLVCQDTSEEVAWLEGKYNAFAASSLHLSTLTQGLHHSHVIYSMVYFKKLPFVFANISS